MQVGHLLQNENAEVIRGYANWLQRTVQPQRKSCTVLICTLQISRYPPHITGTLQNLDCGLYGLDCGLDVDWAFLIEKSCLTVSWLAAWPWGSQLIKENLQSNR